eukprot:gb/GECG01011243.1/.p1 GENE.gb/GECG01011243.1/~~gb/GECG01011243.1/.p1  ORF type:complete len:100 (+),score=9.82 gb/GECG01011243.1/:1-300(+)
MSLFPQRASFAKEYRAEKEGNTFHLYEEYHADLLFPFYQSAKRRPFSSGNYSTSGRQKKTTTKPTPEHITMASVALVNPPLLEDVGLGSMCTSIEPNEL